MEAHAKSQKRTREDVDNEDEAPYRAALKRFQNAVRGRLSSPDALEIVDRKGRPRITHLHATLIVWCVENWHAYFRNGGRDLDAYVRSSEKRLVALLRPRADDTPALAQVLDDLRGCIGRKGGASAFRQALGNLSPFGNTLDTFVPVMSSMACAADKVCRSSPRAALLEELKAADTQAKRLHDRLGWLVEEVERCRSDMDKTARRRDALSKALDRDPGDEGETRLMQACLHWKEVQARISSGVHDDARCRAAYSAALLWEGRRATCPDTGAQ